MAGGTVGDPPKLGRRTRAQGVSPGGFRQLEDLAPKRNRQDPKNKNKKSALSKSIEQSDENAPVPAAPEKQNFRAPLPFVNPTDDFDAGVDATSRSASPQRERSQSPAQHPESRSTSPPENDQPTSTRNNTTGDMKKPQPVGKALRKTSNTKGPSSHQVIGPTGGRGRKPKSSVVGQHEDSDADAEEDQDNHNFRVQRTSKSLSTSRTHPTPGKRTRSASSGGENEEPDTKRLRTESSPKFAVRKPTIPKIEKPITFMVPKPVTGKRDYESSEDNGDDGEVAPESKRVRTHSPKQNKKKFSQASSPPPTNLGMFAPGFGKPPGRARPLPSPPTDENVLDDSNADKKAAPEPVEPHVRGGGIIDEKMIDPTDADTFGKSTGASVRLPIVNPPTNLGPAYRDDNESEDDLSYSTKISDLPKKARYYKEALRTIDKRLECDKTGKQYKGPAWAQTPASPGSMMKSFNSTFPYILLFTSAPGKKPLKLTNPAHIETLRVVAEFAMRPTSKLPSAAEMKRQLEAPKGAKRQSPAPSNPVRQPVAVTDEGSPRPARTLQPETSPTTPNSNTDLPRSFRNRSFCAPGYTDSDVSDSEGEDHSTFHDEDRQKSDPHSELSQPKTVEAPQTPIVPESDSKDVGFGLSFYGALKTVTKAALSPFKKSKFFGGGQQKSDSPTIDFGFKPNTPIPAKASVRHAATENIHRYNDAESIDTARYDDAYHNGSNHLDTRTPSNRTQTEHSNISTGPCEPSGYAYTFTNNAGGNRPDNNRKSNMASSAHEPRRSAKSNRGNKTNSPTTLATRSTRDDSDRQAATERIHGRHAEKQKRRVRFTPVPKEKPYVPIHQRGLIPEERRQEMLREREKHMAEKKAKQREEDEAKDHFNHRGSFRAPSPNAESESESDAEEENGVPPRNPDITIYQEDKEHWLPPEYWLVGAPYAASSSTIRMSTEEAVAYCKRMGWTLAIVSKVEKYKPFYDDLRAKREAEEARLIEGYKRARALESLRAQEEKLAKTKPKTPSRLQNSFTVIEFDEELSAEELLDDEAVLAAVAALPDSEFERWDIKYEGKVDAAAEYLLGIGAIAV